MAVAAELFRLEQLDSELERREGELSEIRRRIARDPESEKAARRLDDLRSQEQTASAAQRRLEAELAEVEAKIERDRKRMYAGSIVDPRELASLEKELAHYGAQRDEIEERLLEAMERAESLQTEVEQAAHDANTRRERWEADRPALERQAEQIIDALAGLRTERDAVAGTLDPASLSRYQRLRSSQGHAVSEVRGGVCSLCRVSLPPKDIQHARGGAIVACTNCQRILYVK